MNLTVDRATLEQLLEALEASQPYPAADAMQQQLNWRRHQAARRALYGLLEASPEDETADACPWDTWRPGRDVVEGEA